MDRQDWFRKNFVSLGFYDHFGILTEIFILRACPVISKKVERLFLAQLYSTIYKKSSPGITDDIAAMWKRFLK